MKLSDWLKLKHGNTARLAKGIIAHSPDVIRWAKEKDDKDYRPCPPAKCLSIERYTGGAVSRKDLRPDDYWTIWPDIDPPNATPRRRREDLQAAQH
jgi:DNA-binding transcriptional regulator YdaS (Cro superfamily)